MKTILSIFTVFISLTFNYLNSQILTAEEVMKNAPYIFEGKVIDYSFFRAEGDKVKLSYLIKVENVLKTNSEFFESDTIELVTFAPEGWGITENNELSIMHGDGHESICTGLDLAFNRTGIFFGKSKEGEFVSFHTTDRFQMMPFSIYCDAFFSVPSYFHDCSETKTDFVFQGFGQRFEHLIDFNDYLCKNNLKPLSIKKKVEYQDSNLDLYKLRIFNNDEYQKNLKNRINQNLRKNQEKSQKNITYEIQNQQITGVNNDFVEFDIVATSNTTGIYIENSAFVISYNSVAFGTNVSANNNVTITNALNYNSSTYMNPMSHITDDTPNAIRFAFGTDYQATSWNRHVLSITPEILMHVKFKLLNCQNATDFLFTNIAQVSNVDFYTTSATVNALTAPIFNFDIITYKQPTNLDLCPPPHIDKFSPQTITAGTESILTISGTGFGNVRGNSQVQFPNSKDGGTSRLQFLDDIDYVSWSDTEIKIKIPSTVQNGNSSNGQLGSGLFLVNKANAQMSNQIAVSPTDLIIKYSIRNDVLGTGTNLRKIPFRFVNRKVNNTFYTREFYLDKSITQDPLKVKIIKKALQDWSCATGINWGVIGEVDAPLNAKDGKSIISFQDMSPSTALAKTYSYSYNICTEGVSNSNEFATLENNETDIVIYKNSTTYPTGDRWFLSETMTGDVPTGKFDFYHVISHELGHAHHLDHVIDKLDLMHYAETPGILSASRTFVKNSLNSIDGGSYIIDKSYLINSNLTNCSSITPLVLYSDDCNGIAKISEINSSNNLQEYPNPFENKIFISYEARNNESIGCSVVDLMGKKVFEKSLKNQYQGLQNEEIDLSHLNSGMYMLELLINGEKEVIKITKK